MKRTNKPVKNFQKKKYYSNRNSTKHKSNSNSWLDGTFSIDPLTWECIHTPKNK